MSPTFTILVPVYQNSSNLDETIPRLLAVSELASGVNTRLLFVDDGSTDGSLQILKNWKRRFPALIKIVKLTRNFGQSPAMLAGLRHCGGSDCVGIISADLQDEPETFCKMLALWTQGHKFVIAERKGREDGWWRSASGRLYWMMLRLFAWKDFPALGYDFCLLDQQLVSDIVGIPEKNTAAFQLIYWLGYRPARIQTIRKKRAHGRSQWTLWRKVRFTVDTLIGFTQVPLRIIQISVALTALVLALNAFGLLPEATRIVLIVQLLSGMATLCVLWMLGVYLSCILDQARGRPLFVVDEIVEWQARSPEAAVESCTTI